MIKVFGSKLIIMIHNGEMCSVIQEKKEKQLYYVGKKLRYIVYRIQYTIYNMPYIFDSMVQYLIDV